MQVHLTAFTTIRLSAKFIVEIDLLSHFEFPKKLSHFDFLFCSNNILNILLIFKRNIGTHKCQSLQN